jgi:hypothetical protein
MNFAFRRSLGSPFTFKAGQARASLLLALGVLLAGSAASAAPARSTADDGKGAPAEETSTSRPATSTQPASSPANLVTGKGVLPIEGASALASELHLSLGQALRKQKLDQVTGPTDVQARLQKAPRVGETVDEASKLLGEASQASLYMKRGDAVRLSRQAIAKLQSVSGRFHAPRLLARANGELALSLLLKPADEAGAKEAFKKAVQAYPAYKPDKDRTHPAALKLLAAARAGWKPMAPKLADFAELSRLCQIETLVWVAVEPVKDSANHVTLTAMAYSANKKTMLGHQAKKVPRNELATHAATLVQLAISGGVLPQKTGPKKLGPVSTPWYKKWWFWTIAGAVIAGGVTTAIVVTNSNKDDGGFDLEVTY